MSLRLSTRLRGAKKATKITIEVDPDESSDSSITARSTKATRHKRRRTTARQPVEVKGIQPVIAELPLDVLREILSYTEPCDLLAFSRVNKAFHATLVSKSNAFLWRKVSKAAGMPPCPSDINDYHYLCSDIEETTR